MESFLGVYIHGLLDPIIKLLKWYAVRLALEDAYRHCYFDSLLLITAGDVHQRIVAWLSRRP